jgi:hypothetical protein
MAYIGRTPIIGNYQVLDAIVATTTDTYALTKDAVAVFPQTPSNCIVSLNGVIQAPVSSYTISGSNIVFDSALTGSDSIDFITVLGDVLSIGTPTDGTVTTAKLVDSSVTTAKLNDGSVSLAKLTATGTQDATTFLRGDNTFAEAGGGKLLQAVTATDSTTRTTSSTSFVTVSNTLSVSITPSSASNKIFLIASGSIYNTTASVFCVATIFRDATDLGAASNKGLTLVYTPSASDIASAMCMSVLDSPNTTSAITYQVYFRASAGSASLNFDGNKGSITAFEIQG